MLNIISFYISLAIITHEIKYLKHVGRQLMRQKQAYLIEELMADKRLNLSRTCLGHISAQKQKKNYIVPKRK